MFRPNYENFRILRFGIRDLRGSVVEVRYCVTRARNEKTLREHIGRVVARFNHQYKTMKLDADDVTIVGVHKREQDAFAQRFNFCKIDPLVKRFPFWIESYRVGDLGMIDRRADMVEKNVPRWRDFLKEKEICTE